MKKLISSSPTWDSLATMSKTSLTLRNAFAEDADRSARMTHKAAAWTIDFSRQLLNKEVTSLLHKLAHESGLDQAKDAMFSGTKVNKTENRSVLHAALRALSSDSIMVDGSNVIGQVQQELEKMKRFTSMILSGEMKGYTGKKIRSVVAMGIGGSNLGPEMACKALHAYSTGLDVRFVSNVDPTDITLALTDIEADETLFIVSSKTFTTTETMQNAFAARDWFIKRTGSESAISKHFVAVSTNADLVRKFGILPENMFIFWDWVGGRYSMTSVIGLPIMLSIGTENFTQMLEGFREIDIHYRSEPLETNVPVLMALVNLWNTSFMGMQTHAVVAYDEYLALLPDHLQQLVMESLGKGVTEDGDKVRYATCPVFFGGVGTNVQHSYFQLLHQGAGITVPVDFIGFIESLHPIKTMHKDLFLNMIAQANVMAFGETETELSHTSNRPELIPHQVIPGNKPSTILICEKLTPRTFGQLVSLYENMVHAWGTLLGINAFDQFGVEAGKRMAKQLGTQLPGNLTVENAFEMLCYKPKAG